MFNIIFNDFYNSQIVAIAVNCSKCNSSKYSKVQ